MQLQSCHVFHFCMISLGQFEYAFLPYTMACHRLPMNMQVFSFLFRQVWWELTDPGRVECSIALGRPEPSILSWGAGDSRRILLRRPGRKHQGTYVT